MGPFARRLTSLVLRLFVRSVTRSFVFSGLVVSCGRLVSSVLVASRWLSVLAVLSLFWSFWNLSLCSLLAVLYARYRWRRTFVAICGGRLDVISPSSCFCSCSFMVTSLRSVLLLSFRTKRFILSLDLSSRDLIPWSKLTLIFSMVVGKMLSAEHRWRKVSLCLIVAKLSLLRNIFSREDLLF